MPDVAAIFRNNRQLNASSESLRRLYAYITDASSQVRTAPLHQGFGQDRYGKAGISYKVGDEHIHVAVHNGPYMQVFRGGGGVWPTMPILEVEREGHGFFSAFGYRPERKRDDSKIVIEMTAAYKRLANKEKYVHLRNVLQLIPRFMYKDTYLPTNADKLKIFVEDVAHRGTGTLSRAATTPALRHSAWDYLDELLKAAKDDAAKDERPASPRLASPVGGAKKAAGTALKDKAARITRTKKRA